MDSNGNQRKRGGRIAKNGNGNEKSPSQNIEHEFIHVSPIEESEASTTAPAAECRRSSRKKIIKFDVRDLLNKNRKTHKIQIEARIDSNAPTTSKGTATCGIETSNSKTSSTREDLLSKQKTFLEKSAIFRRFSISQEPKPPPPPLPIPLLGKANEDKDVGFSCSSSSRRLSRTQEFFSNVMIKPKQTTSLIVAQIESNTPCSVATAKRKNICKSIETKVITRPANEYSLVVQQKKRGRPAKIKAHTSAENSVPAESVKKKMTPEKAKNWKEYKACLAQQSTGSKEEKDTIKIKEKVLSDLHQKDQKQDMIKYFDDTLQSDISRSDDDGNFSGFQTSKDDISCDSPVPAKTFFEKETLNNLKASKNENNETKFGEEKTTKTGETIKSNEKDQNIKIRTIETNKIVNMPQVVDSSQNEKQNLCLTDSQKVPFEETSEILLKTLNTVETETKDFAKPDLGVSKEFNSQKDTQKNASIIEQAVSNFGRDAEKIIVKMASLSPDFSQNKEIDNKSDVSSGRGQLNLEKRCVQHKHNEYQEIQKTCSTEIIDNTTSKTPTRNTHTEMNSGDIRTNKIFISSPILQKDIAEAEFKQERAYKTISCVETSLKLRNAEPEAQNELQIIDILAESTQIDKEDAPHTELTISDVLLLANEMPQIQPSTASKEIKSFSRTSSSSESENASEHGSYLSEPFSTSSSSSSRSYKSCDNLRVSVKRISLPKSPSTSSQTSTSEELNNCKILKKKPPMTKRSKRLQKKSVEILKNENASKTIDDCFQTKPTDNINVVQNTYAQISEANIMLSTGQNKTEICKKNKLEINAKENKSNQLVKNVVTESKMQETAQDSYENVASEITDLLSNESSNVIKRKSFRNRKDNSGNENYEEMSKQKTLEKEIETDIKLQILLPNESDEILENTKKKPTAIGKNLEGQKTTGIDQSETVKSQLEKHQTKEMFRKPSLVAKDENLHTEDKTKILTTSKETTIETTENIPSGKLVIQSTTIDKKAKNVIELIGEDKLSMVSEPSTSVKTSEKNTEAIKNKAGQMNVPIHPENPKCTQDKTKSHNLNLTSTIKIASSRNTTNKEGISKKEFQFQNKKPVDDKVDETGFREDFTQSSETESAQEEKSIYEIVHASSAMSIEDKTKASCEKSVAADREIGVDKPVKSSNITSTRKEISTEEIFAKEIETDKQNLKSQVKDEKAEEFSTKFKNGVTISEIIHDETLNRTEGKIETLGENLAAIDKTVNLNKTVSTRRASNMQEICLRDSNNQVEYPTHCSAQGNAFNKEDISLTANENKCYDEFLTNDTELNATTSSQTQNKANVEYLSKENPDDNSTDKLLETTSEEKKSAKILTNFKKTETKKHCNKYVLMTDEELPVNNKDLANLTNKERNSPVAPKSSKSKKAARPTIPSVSPNENSEQTTTELFSACFLPNITSEMPVKREESVPDINIEVENLTSNQSLSTQTRRCLKPHSSAKISPKMSSSTSSLIKTLPYTHAEFSKASPNTELSDESQQADKSKDEVKLIIEKCTSNTQLENTEKNKEQILVKGALTKIRARKSRFKNLYVAEVDSETDSSNGKNTPVDEKLKIPTKTPHKNQVEDKGVQSPPNVFQPDISTCKIQKKFGDNIRGEPASLQENSQSNLLSSQIKNVSIETNTLLDILRTVQSNTEAALKANKSPINTDITNNENTIESETKMKFEEYQDLYKIQQQDSKTISPSRFDTESQIVKKFNICPERSDAVSPLTLNKVIPSPTRSNSSSPLTLKKVPRRYERRSRRGEVSAHKTLEETFAEIAAQSSKAVLAAKEYDASDEQTTGEKSQKELDEINAAPNIEKEPIKETFTELEKATTDEKPSRRCENFAHITLKETYAELAAQSSKSVLTVTEYDDSEEQITEKNFIRELDDFNTAPNIEKEQVKETFAELQKPTDEKQSRTGEDFAYKTLKETCAEIAAQSFEAILTTKEQTTGEKSQKEFIDINLAPKIEKEQIKHTFTELQKATIDERQSRRGEDSVHKTLEETFAEIAAQSSKAVLVAKEYDVSDEQIADKKLQEELDDTVNAPNFEIEEIREKVVEIQKPTTYERDMTTVERRGDRDKDSAHESLEETFAEIATQSSKAISYANEYTFCEEQTIDFSEKEQFKEQLAELQKSTTDAETAVETLLNISQDETPIDSKENVGNSIENVVEVDTIKVTPPKRGRKPKNRPLDASITVTMESLAVKNTSRTKKETITIKEVGKEDKIEKETEERIMQETKNEDKTNKSKNEFSEVNQTSKISLPLLTNLQVDPKESANLTELLAKASFKTAEVNENKSSKRSNKKRDTKAVIEEDALVSNVAACVDKEGEVRNPKQPTKKRDSSLNKSESKSVGKKPTKKTKNVEEDTQNLQKEDFLVQAAGTTGTPTSKRGRKPKNLQPETQQHTTSSKKKNKKDKNEEEDINVEQIQLLDPKSEFLNTSLDKSLDEKLEKKKRQMKLKEDFEAALADDFEKSKEALQTESSSSISNTSFGLTLFNNSPPPESSQSICNEEVNEAIKFTCVTPIEMEEDPDPLKDIEKFIADGVNLLKKDYKLDEDSVDDVIQSCKTTEIAEESVKVNTEETKPIFNTFETPADTPINTPSATPPPKSPTSTESSTPDENSGVRRSHRIKLITKTPKALVGRGLVRDKERFSIKDDVETKSHYTLDDHLTDLAEVEAKNAKFLKEMEERLSNFQVIKENEYLCERVISREARKMICDCFLTQEEEERGELGCGEDCLNRLLMIECGPECNVKERCTNKRFQKLLCSPCRVFRTEKKGFGIMADIEILPGEFIMEYVGEVIDTEEFEKRRIIYSQDKNRHYYFMALRSDAIIDATIKGNISRFINHSCDPNAETQKWTVNGELRIGFFSRKSIMPGEEITFNYQYQRYGREAQRCYCESTNCRGWIGQEPTSDEGEQMDYEDDESEDDDEEEEEGADTSNLLVQDDDEDSDASVADPEEVQKQLEMAAAQAEVELAPLQLLEEKTKHGEITSDEGKSIPDFNKLDNEEDSKSKFKKLLSKMAEKVAAKQKQNKREQKLQRKKKSKKSSSELTNKLRFLEDPDIEDEVEFLKECGLKNQSDTLRLSRLMVRAKLVQTRLNLLEILRKGDFPCRRLFLDYHGLRLLHGWMSEDAGNMQIRLSLLQTLETLPIANKTVLTDSKVMQVVRSWCGNNTNLSPNDDSSSSNSNSQDLLVPGSATVEEGSEMAELQKLGLKLITTWEGLPEIFRIPKKERIEQMKEHEREADRQYAANAETQENTAATDRYRRDRFGRGLNTPNSGPTTSNRFVKPNSGNSIRITNATTENIKNLSKAQRREMFAAKVARDEAEKRLVEERREFETKCRFFGLDPKKTRIQDIPFCVNPATGQWYSIERKPITTPPSYAHVQVPVKPKSTDPNDYQLPAVCSTLPPQWKYAITPQGKIYYYHIKYRIPQWEPPSTVQLQQCDLEAREEDSESELTTTAGEDSSDDDDDILIGMDAAQLKAYIDKKVETRRQKRYQRLVDERSISPRREEDRIYNQLEVRKYKENKEKIRKRKEDIRRKRAEALRQTSLNMCTLGSVTDANPNTNKLSTESDEELRALPIQDYLLSSDEENDLKAEVNSPLIDKIVEGDKIVDELDALTTKRQLKRPLPPHRDLNEPSSASSSSASTSVSNTLVAKPEYKKRKLEKKEKRKPKEQDAKYRKNKEKFRCEIAGIIVHHLKPYLKETCTMGHIQSNEDFNHLARKLTHFVMIKELKYCESVGQILVVTESVKSKSREFIKKYMAKYGDVYVKPTNDPDFKDIPFTL